MNNLVLMDLVNRVKVYDKTAFEEIYNLFSKLIGHFSRRVYKEDTKEELTVFLLELIVSLDLSRFEADESNSIQRYIAVSLRNKYIAFSAESKKRVKQNVTLNYESLIYYDRVLDKLSAYEALKRLSEKQRTVIVYKYIYNYTDTEIANMLNISRQAVNRLKNRSMESLKRYYSIKS